MLLGWEGGGPLQDTECLQFNNPLMGDDTRLKLAQDQKLVYDMIHQV